MALPPLRGPRYHPWPCFLINLVLLSWASLLAPDGKWGFDLIWTGIAFCFLGGLALSLGSPSTETPWPRKDWFKKIHPALGAVLVGAACFIRLFRLVGQNGWPSFDEGVCSFQSLELMQHWHWQFFFTWVQCPPLFTWLLAWFYKIVPPSLFSFWLFQALISLATLPIAYFSLRASFSKTLTWTALLLLTFSFWHLYVSRDAFRNALIPAWEIMTLGLMGFHFQQKKEGRRAWTASLLGFTVLLGPFTSISSPCVGLAVVVAFLAHAARGRRLIRLGAFFSLGAAAPALLFLWAAQQEHYGRYIQSLWSFQGNTHWAGQAAEAFNYAATLFSRASPGQTDWLAGGGMLNPITGALFLTGFFELIRTRHFPFSRWLLLFAILAALPGLATRGFEILRVMSLFPLLTLTGAIGLLRLGGENPGRGRLLLLGGLLLVSSAWDLQRFFGDYYRVWGLPGPQWAQQKSEPLFKADQILEKKYRSQGPGAVLLELWPFTSDESLTTASYAFNASRNCSLPLSSLRWIALILEPDFKPFLSGRFPAARWFWLGNLPPPHSGSIALCVIPLTPSNREKLLSFVQADQALQPATSAVLDLPPTGSQAPVFKRLDVAKPACEGDPYLRACWWEKTYQRQSVENNFPGMLEALRGALREGYPCAHLYDLEGLLLENMGRKKDAQRAFQKALLCPLNLTAATDHLKALQVR
jgi:4-amino-4-deoxy-L-arabinose transferase-like glycosyltransferase